MKFNFVIIIIFSNFLNIFQVQAQCSREEHDRTLYKVKLNDQLIEKVNDFIELYASQAYDSLEIMSILKSNILFIETEECEDKTVIYLGTASYVNKKYSMGYAKLKEYLIVFYNLNDLNSFNLITIQKKYSNLNKLRKYPDENSDIAKDYLIEPRGWKMIVNDDGSMKIIYKGYL